MSFAEFGGSSSTGGIPIALSSTSNNEFKSQVDKVSTEIFRISGNVAAIQRLLATLGSIKDTPELRHQLHDITEQTRNDIKTTNVKVKKIVSANSDSAESVEGRQMKLAQKKIQKDFEEVLKRFQSVSKMAAEKSREIVSKARVHQAIERLESETTESEPLLGRQHRLEELRSLEHEIELNEALVTEREEELVNIEQSIHEVNEIFRDLGTLVNEQQYLLGNHFQLQNEFEHTTNWLDSE